MQVAIDEDKQMIGPLVLAFQYDSTTRVLD